MKKILIVGAGVAGQDVLRELKRAKNGYKVVGFIDDDLKKKNKVVKGTTIFGSKDLIPSIVKTKGIDEVIIAIPSANGKQISDVVKICSGSEVSFRIVPRVREIIEGQAHIKSLRKVEVEDLLGRPIIKSDVEGLIKFFHGERVLITGAAGSIGSELSRQICAYKPKEITFVDWWENGIFELQMELTKLFPELKLKFLIADIKDKRRMEKIFSESKPNYIYHAAAYKHVPLMEENPVEAVKNNIFGTLNIATLAKKNGVERFVIVSTDKAAKPKNIMGTTKLVTEGIGRMMNGKTKFMAVRFGNVLGSFGSVVPIFRRQIEEGGPITITDKRMTRYFMTIPEAAQLILKAGSLGQGGELFVLDMGKPVRILDLANQMIRLSGLEPQKDIKIVYTGVRKGEKIREKLFNDKEKLSATKDGKIFKTESFGVDISELPDFLKRLNILVSSENVNLVVKELRKLGAK